MSTEMALGRATHSSPIGAFRKLGGSLWSIVGLMSVLVAFLILSFYSVVGGWTIAYFVKAFNGEIAQSLDPTHNAEVFSAFVQSPLSPLLFHFIFAFITFFTVIAGVQRGIERLSKYLMPLLLILMAVLIVRGLTLPNAWEGLRFFLTPDFSKITGQTFFEALGLAFFSLSLGVGIMITYGSYVAPDTKLINSSIWVILLTLFTCILAGLMVLPAAFALGFEASVGPGLTFITMPAVFASMPFSSIFAMLFFFLLFVAALTSTISLLEVIVSFLIDEFQFKRQNAGILAFILFLSVGIVASLSLGIWSPYRIFGLNIFDALDKLTQNILMPLGEILLAIFAAWVVWKTHIESQLAESGNHYLLIFIRYCLGLFVPLVIGYIFYAGLVK